MVMELPGANLQEEKGRYGWGYSRFSLETYDERQNSWSDRYGPRQDSTAIANKRKRKKGSALSELAASIGNMAASFYGADLFTKGNRQVSEGGCEATVERLRRKIDSLKVQINCQD